VGNSSCITDSTIIGLEGGEFLLHPDALEIMEWFKNHHPNYDLLSNCLKPDKLIHAVKQYKPRRLWISLDGDKDTYKYMRGRDGYENVLNVIEALKDVLPVSVMFTLSPYNDYSDLQHVAEHCKKSGVDLRVGFITIFLFLILLKKRI
jgi:MoaA/NifB/PqqE/SkfB family radical SAM enzyme